MLTKLLKYEFKASARTYGGLYLALLAAAALLGAGLGSKAQSSSAAYINNVLMLIYIGLCVAVAVVTVMTIVQRFNRNLLGREGYLMHTLPVTPAQLIGSKLISSTVWSVCGIAVGCASVALMLIACSIGGGESIISVFKDIFSADWGQFFARRNNGLPLLQFAAALIILMLASGICLILRIYAACMVGHQFKKHPAVVGVAVFFALTWAQSWLVGKITDTAAVHFETNVTLSGVEQGVTWYMLFGTVPAELTSSAELWAGVAFSAVLCAVFGAVYFALTAWLMSNRLELE